MHYIGRNLVVVGSVLGLGLIGSLLTTGSNHPGVLEAASPGPTVTIAGPLPLPVNGAVTVANTPNVNVANTPGVTVTNTPNVNVANTPNVNVANMPSVNVSNASLPVTGSVSINGTPNVNISNSSLTVTPGASDPGSPNFMPTAASNNGVSQGQSCEVMVPGPDSGHRLVIEYISAYGQVQPASSRVTQVTVSENFFRFHYFAPSSQLPDGVGNNNWVVSQPVRLYIDPGASLTLDVSGDVNVTGGNCSIYYTGYLVPTS